MSSSLSQRATTAYTGSPSKVSLTALWDSVRHSYDDVSSMLAETDDYSVFSAGDLILAENFLFKVAASTATDHDHVNSGGVKIYVQRNSTENIPARAMGEITGTGLTNHTTIQAAIDYFGAANGGEVVLPPIALELGGTLLLRENVQLRGGGRQGHVQTQFGTIIRPTSAVAVAVQNDTTDGRNTRISGIGFDMGNMPAGAKALDLDSSRSPVWQVNVEDVNIWNIPASGIGINLDASANGLYWSTFRRVFMSGDGVNGLGVKTNWAGSGPRVTSTIFELVQCNDLAAGWDMDGIGSGVEMRACGAESNVGAGLTVGDISSALKIHGGEFSSNGTWGLTGGTSAYLLLEAVNFAANTNGDVDWASLDPEKMLVLHDRGYLQGRLAISNQGLTRDFIFEIQESGDEIKIRHATAADQTVSWEGNGSLGRLHHDLARGQVYGGRTKIQAKTANYAVGFSDIGTTITNKGASGPITITLPAGNDPDYHGAQIGIHRLASQVVHIGGASASFAVGDGAVGQTLDLNSDGANVVLELIDGGGSGFEQVWRIKSSHGTIGYT